MNNFGIEFIQNHMEPLKQLKTVFNRVQSDFNEKFSFQSFLFVIFYNNPL